MASMLASVGSRILGRRARLEVTDVFREHEGTPFVARCRVSGSDSAPATVVVKAPRPWKPYEPDKPGGPAAAIFTEWAALEWLGELDVPDVPRLLGADREPGVLVMSDMAHDRRVDHVLLGEDPVAATDALREFGASLGRLHAATMGKDPDEWRRRRERLGPRADFDRRAWFAEQVAHLHRACEAVGVEAQGIDDDLETLREAWNAGPHHALTHGDPCPDNLLLDGGRVVIVDFENAACRFAPSDAGYARIPFPSCWCVGALPDSAVTQMEDAYRAAAGFGDDAEWRRLMTLACGQSFLYTVPTQVTHCLEKDHSWGTTGLRARAPLRSESFAAAARDSGTLDRLAELASGIAAKCRKLWPDDTHVPPYPAFRLGLRQKKKARGPPGPRAHTSD
ncbi:MAG TPA: aminoglycoside phosphotransferase family protein [Actinomycetota bacterium]|nr:aminoglycoside phosphotransferase family protein [Actinomycetota bacterium]